MTEERKKSRVDFGWEDGECAGVTAMKCRCGYSKFFGEERLFSDKQKWICPNCGNVIRFVWLGMRIRESRRKVKK